MKIEARLFWVSLAILAVIWGLRGFGLLTFFPGGVIWIVLLITIGLGVFALIQGTRRW
ncbi:hypothetical protein [Vacuolonema iberomarrocanum]|uniref:hypothetical protein n=1 Tax=Vacuolonema iberomarrocanum TaxID=3454632 RepID=UPI001A0C196E|nr:hypothetical protein [filamentous cyanobacterium LEGE 07170]